MYTPAHFALDDPSQQQALIADNPFAQLITMDGDGLPHASHLPFLFFSGRLDGHMAKANPQWQHFQSNRDVLAIFSGPHGYISPSWYKNAPNVPTWNYTALHVYGRPRLIEDADQKKARQAHLVEVMESGFDVPWRMELPESYEQGMLAGIVTFEIEITRMEGKAKLSQNRKPEDLQGAITGLRATGRAEDERLADVMAAQLG
ncbi:MAG: FMN-binding negative transcriptional regulator [Proteobacteria bacterium]|nr:FMN-binding negative transcriptional regulator [Pseudomonadota bacterium]